MYYSRPEEAMIEVARRLKNAKDDLGLNDVFYGEDELRWVYPICQIIGDPVTRERETQQQFKVMFNLQIWIYHASMGEDHQTRTLRDMEIATNVVKFLHTPDNRKLVDSEGDQKLIFSYITSELPGRILRDAEPSIITTRLLWQGESRVNFSDS